MKERGIIFNAGMVRSILSGQKTQTRRVCKPMQQWTNQDCREVRTYDGSPHHFIKGAELPIGRLDCPFGKVGDRLWVREAWRLFNRADECGCESPCSCPSSGTPLYRASHDDGESKWRPSIHMPRWASRILLEITGVWVERLNDISEEDARSEGVSWSDGSTTEVGLPTQMVVDAKDEFARLWQSIYGEESWRSNPWVWCISFMRIKL